MGQHRCHEAHMGESVRAVRLEHSLDGPGDPEVVHERAGPRPVRPQPVDAHPHHRPAHVQGEALRHRPGTVERVPEVSLDEGDQEHGAHPLLDPAPGFPGSRTSQAYGHVARNGENSQREQMCAVKDHERVDGVAGGKQEVQRACLRWLGASRGRVARAARVRLGLRDLHGKGARCAVCLSLLPRLSLRMVSFPVASSSKRSHEDAAPPDPVSRRPRDSC